MPQRWSILSSVADDLQKTKVKTAGRTCMQIDTAQLCLNLDDFLRTALPFVCCFVSVLCRHHGLDPSNTRYSKCMNFFPTTIYLSWQASLSQSCLDADQNLRSKSKKRKFQKPWFIFCIWAHVLVACSQIFSHCILWRCEKYQSAISIIRAALKETIETCFLFGLK